MKHKSILLITFCLTLITLCACNGKKKNHDGQDVSVTEMKADVKAKKYPFEKGIVYQKTSAMGIESNPVVYFDKWGEWEATETVIEMEMMGQKMVTRELEITKGNDYWKINLEEKTGVHFNRPPAISPMGMDMEKISKEMLGEMNIELLGEETFLGYPCKKYRLQSDKNTLGMEYLLYGNLMMKMKGEAMGMPVTTEVIKIETVAPPAEKFEVPADVEITKY
ncbi:DUF4412 domain-containing protein [Proteiniphilum acetatigenes]|uniref:DUF4412 domain-containing protein n=1 Tax=Proteiniphilum acetatigenes TaxID=294710 RepID=UPI0012F73FE1|nr:DUF4412 domain-containing protein [Proteiniphilum acetatigenes]